MKYSCPFDLSTARLSVPSGAEKSASLAAFFGVGGVGHLASNASGRAGHHGSNLAEVMAHRGFQHGLLEQKINPARQLAMKAMFGPEALADYEVARRAGGAAVQHAPDPVTRDRYLKALYGVIDTEKNLDGAPIIDPLRRALQHEFMGTTPQFAAKGRVANLYGKAVDRLAGHTQTGFETGAQKAVGMLEGAAPAAMFAGADTLLTGSPMGALGHFSVNGAREVGAQLFGERFAQSEIAKGLAGKLPSAGWQKAVDYAVSPALLDARRAGDHLRRSMPPEMAAQSAEHVTNAQHIYDNIKGIKATFHDAKNHEGGINALMGDQIRQIETASENIRGIPDTFKNPAYHDDIINTVAGDYIRKGQDLKNRAGAAVTDARDHFNNWRSSKVPAGSNGVAPQGADPASYFYSPEQGRKKCLCGKITWVLAKFLRRPSKPVIFTLRKGRHVARLSGKTIWRQRQRLKFHKRHKLRRHRLRLHKRHRLRLLKLRLLKLRLLRHHKLHGLRLEHKPTLRKMYQGDLPVYGELRGVLRLVG